MKLGLNLSFAVKRWLDPVQLAGMIKNDLGVDHVQFTWDLINPWWPQAQRDVLVYQYKDAFEDAGVKIDATIAGRSAYSYGHLFAPAKVQRDVSLVFFKRAIDLTVEMGSTVMGTPVGGMTHNDAMDLTKREGLYQDMLGYLRKLAEYGKVKGLKEIHVEASPMITEFDCGSEISIRMMKDLEGTDIPVKLMVDWGEVLCKPVWGEEADIEKCFDKCAPYIGSILLQQTDGQKNRHWDFTHEDGIVTPELIKRATANARLEDITQYVTVVPDFEDSDDKVYESMKRTMEYLHRELD